MNEKVHICYNTAKRFLLELLESNDFSKDEDVIKTLRATVQKEKASHIDIMEPSKLIIDKQCNIYLPGFCLDEIKMAYLPKTIFLFFLLHPEGVDFKSLYNYAQELYDIYQVVSSEKNTEAGKMRNTIKNLVDLTTNRIYESCSNSRKELRTVIPEELLEQYCIIGKQGDGRHLILLNRNFISIENDKLKVIQSNIFTHLK